MEAVDQVLAERARDVRAGRGQVLSLAAAGLLHLAVVAAAIALPHLRPDPEPLEFVTATIIPAQALGVERPRQRTAPQPTPPAPEPAAAPEPEAPAPEPEPKEMEPEPDRPTLPSKEEAKKPAAEKPAPEKPRKPAAPEPKKPTAPTPGAKGAPGSGGAGAEIGKGEEEGRRGSATGNPLGTSAFGSEIAGLADPNFTYGYYVDRLLQLIDANWTRPPLGGQVRTIVHFRIRRDGSIEDLSLAESSGFNSFDLAALRAVQNASPFPALPASYRHPSLGVNLIVR